jgi:hypothetical protein
MSRRSSERRDAKAEEEGGELRQSLGDGHGEILPGGLAMDALY